MKRAASILAGFGALIMVQAGAVSAPAVPAVPQAQPLVLTPPSAGRYRGSITEINGPFLTLKTTDKKTMTVGVTTSTRVIHNRLLQLSDLQPGWYVGLAAVKGGDGKLRASAIRLYPENMRGQGEGEYPIDQANPLRLFVGGSILSVAPGGIGGTLTLTFTGNAPDESGACTGHATAVGCEATVEVLYARGVPIVSVEEGDPSLLQPGATVSVQVAPDINGTLVAAAITIERDAPIAKE